MRKGVLDLASCFWMSIFDEDGQGGLQKTLCRCHTKCDRNSLRNIGRLGSMSSNCILGLKDPLSFLNSSERFFTGKNEEEISKSTASA